MIPVSEKINHSQCFQRIGKTRGLTRDTFYSYCFAAIQVPGREISRYWKYCLSGSVFRKPISRNAKSIVGHINMYMRNSRYCIFLCFMFHFPTSVNRTLVNINNSNQRATCRSEFLKDINQRNATWSVLSRNFYP